MQRLQEERDAERSRNTCEEVGATLLAAPTCFAHVSFLFNHVEQECELGIARGLLCVSMPGDEGSVVLAFVADRTRGINPTKHEHTRAGLRRAQGAIQCGGTVAG